MTMNLVGRVTNDLELKRTDKCEYVSFGLAVNEGFGKNKTVTYFDCIAFGSEAERLVKAQAKKGSVIQMTGKFSKGEYEKDGVKHVSLKLTVLWWSYTPSTGSKKENGISEDSNTQPPVQPSGEQLPGYENFNLDMELGDDELPF